MDTLRLKFRTLAANFNFQAPRFHAYAVLHQLLIQIIQFTFAMTNSDILQPYVVNFTRTYYSRAKLYFLFLRPFNFKTGSTVGRELYRLLLCPFLGGIR